MTRKNPYENQDETLDIPDFFDEKTSEKQADTDSSTVDMSIFKMSDEELYDDVKDETDEITSTVTRSSRKLNTTALLGVLVMLLLLVTSVGALIYGLNQHRAYVKANTNYMQVLANQDAYKKQIAEKDATIENLNKQIDELKNKAANLTTGVYEIVDGPITFRSTPERSGEATTYNGYETAEDGEKYDVLEIVRGLDDPDYSWARIADNIYFCLGTADDVWARKSN